MRALPRSVHSITDGSPVADQITAGLVPEPDLIVAPLGSGGTVAGLLVGARSVERRPPWLSRSASGC